MLKGLIRQRGRSKYLDINWRIRGYEVFFILFTLLCLYLVSLSPLNWSGSYARLSVFMSVQFLGAMYLLALGVSFVKLLLSKSGGKWAEVFKWERFLQVSFPYCTLDFLVLSIRRCVAVFGTIYFFLHLKHVILYIHNANWDLFYWDLDRKLHFGVQPNIWAMLKFGVNHDLAVFIDFLYIKYFSYKSIVCLFFMLELKGRALSEKFFTAYVLCWTLGGIGYVLTPADGPCYAVLGAQTVDADKRTHVFQFPITRDVPAEYITNFENSKIWYAKAFQQKLWNERHDFIMGKRFPGMFYGIAAMPSLHVAAVSLIAIFVTRASVIAGVFTWMFVGTTFFGSVLLQWHYAVDGYLGFLIAVAACFSTKLFPRRVFEDG